MAAAIRRTSPGSKEAPQASGPGKTVAPNVMNPVRHSSCATAGIPNRPDAVTCRCSEASRSIPASAVTGAVPYTRVSWPSPWAPTSSRPGAGPPSSSSIGATGAPGSEGNAQKPASCPAFSSSVILPSRSATRTDAGRRGSRQGSFKGFS
jgi:hypothetical protein